MIDSAVPGLQNELDLKERSKTLEFFYLIGFQYTLLDSAFSALQNEVDLKRRSNILEFFLLS